MSKIGLHFSSYQSMDYLERFLKPWVEFKKNNDLIISVGHVCFKEFQEMGFPVESKDKTHEKLEEYHKNKEIDYYQFITDPLTEAEARTKILEPLLEQNIDVLWIAGADEFYTICEIEDTIKYVQKEPFVTWFRIEFKNLVFNESTYIKGFNPGRIFRTTSGGLKIKSFYYDDDLVYSDGTQDVNYKMLASKQTPIKLCNPLHATWLDDKRSFQKYQYQVARWGLDGCSYAYENGKLVFNRAFYTKHQVPVPETYTL